MSEYIMLKAYVQDCSFLGVPFNDITYKGKSFSVYSLVSTEVLTRPSSPSRLVHT